jgi:hypothetical protein
VITHIEVGTPSFFHLCLQLESTGKLPAWRRAAERFMSGSKLHHSRSQERLRKDGVSHTARRNPATGRWEVAPVRDGRIRRVGEEEGTCGGDGGGSNGGQRYK